MACHERTGDVPVIAHVDSTDASDLQEAFRSLSLQGAASGGAGG
jgi:hypothetical protein